MAAAAAAAAVAAAAEAQAAVAKAAGAEAVLESSGLSEAITRLSVKLIEYHGKAGYDAMGNVPKKAMEAAIEQQLVLNPSTRELVLFLAEHKPRPEQAKEEKSGWEAVDRYFWGYMDTRHFTKFTVPESEGFKGSKSYHEFVGMCKVAEEAEKNGPLRAREMFCACDPCLVLDLDDCLMQAAVGRAVRVQTKLPKGGQLRRPQVVALEEWRDWLESGKVVAVRPDSSERHLDHDNPYWLALVKGAAFVVPDEMMYAGEKLEKGMLVVPVQWYNLEQVSERGYSLLPARKLLELGTMVRLRGLAFTGTQGGPAGRELRGPTATGARAGRAASSLSFLCEDMHNDILMACDPEVTGEEGRMSAAEAVAAREAQAAAFENFMAGNEDQL